MIFSIHQNEFHDISSTILGLLCISEINNSNKILLKIDIIQMRKKKIIIIAISTIICLLAYLPTPRGRDPQVYTPAQPKSLNQTSTFKDKLRDAVYITTPAPGAEDVEIDDQGYVYSGLSDGSIIRFKGNESVQMIAKSQGHIFGLDLSHKNDKLAIADQISGIKILDLKTRKMQYVISQFNGHKFASPNAVVFGKNDEVLYFTVSSNDIKMSAFHEMLLYSDGSGKIFSHNLKTNHTEILADNLYFVNGLEYSEAQNCLYFVETSRSRLSRLHLEGQNKKKIELVIGDILGYPDNVKITKSGELWVAIPALRDSLTHIIDHNPVLRKIMLNMRTPLSMFLMVANMKYSGGIKVNPKKGQIVDYFFGKSDKISCISGMNQKYGKLYLASLTLNKIAVVDLQQEKVSQTQQKTQKQNQAEGNIKDL